MSQSVTPAIDAEVLLSVEEVQALVLAVLADGRVADEHELERVADWARGVRVESALLSGVLDSRLGVAWVEGEDQPKFWIRSERAA